MDNHVSKISLDMSGDFTSEYVGAKKGDTGGRVVEITLTNDGKAYKPAGTDSLVFRVTKPSGFSVQQPVSLSGGVISVTLTEQMLAEEGVAFADVAVIDSGEVRMSSATFRILVRPSAGEGKDIDSDNEFMTLDELTRKAALQVKEHTEWGKYLVAILISNGYITPITDEDGNMILDEDGMVIIAD